MADLRGKPIAITGASSGIGRATAIACARAGMPVALGARRRDKLDAVVAEISSIGGRAVAVPVDVASPEDCRRLVGLCISEFGGIYAAFANAGYGFEKPFLDTTDEEIRAIFETNFYGTLNTVRAALPHLLKARSGHILVCSSSISKLGSPYFAPYSASKAAQEHIARALRTELAGSGVYVSSVHPIGTRTDFFNEVDRRSAGKSMGVHTPETFMQTPDRVARAVLRCLGHPRGEVWTSTPARLALALGTAFPGLADRVLVGYARRRNRIIERQDSTPAGSSDGRGDQTPL